MLDIMGHYSGNNKLLIRIPDMAIAISERASFNQVIHGDWGKHRC
jgi:hypothetical protein